MSNGISLKEYIKGRLEYLEKIEDKYGGNSHIDGCKMELERLKANLHDIDEIE